MLFPLGFLDTFRGVVDKYLAANSSSTPFLNAYRFTNGFGTKYANPADSIDSASEFRFAPNNQTIAGGISSGGNTLNSFAWSDSGFGSRLAGGVFLTFSPQAVDIHPNSNALAIIFGSATTDVRAWSYSNSGIGTQFTAPATSPIAPRNVRFHPSGDYLGVADRTSSSSPFGYYAYAWSGSGFGTRITTANVTGGVDTVFDVEFSPDGNTFFLGLSSSPWVYAWPFSAGFGTQYANPATLIGSTVRSIAIAKDNSAIVATSQNSPYIHAYAFSAGFGTKFADPATLPASASNVRFSRSGNRIAFGSGSSKISVYRWANGFGSKYSDPATNPSANVGTVAWG
jgi:hypothetical protein